MASAELQTFLREYRDSKKLSQPEMASHIGIGYRTYQEIEKSGIVKKVEYMDKIKSKTGWDDTQENVYVGDIGHMQRLIESNSIMAKAQLVAAETSKIDATAREKLIDIQTGLAQMLKSAMDNTIEPRPQDNPQVFDARLEALLEVVAELGVGSSWKSKSEGVAVLHKKVYSDPGKQKR
jgi:DNA-binding XRE family transcriptional regulator